MSSTKQELSDEALLKACCKDDIRAYNELVDRYAPRLHKLGMRYLKDFFVVEELAMDLLFDLWKRRHTLIIEKSLSAYLFRAFRNLAIRRLQKKLTHSVEIDEVPEREMPLSYKSADGDLVYWEAENEYQKNLAALSPKRRMVFELSREENLSYKAIAERMNLSVNTVENYMVSALAFLREKYKDHPGTIILLTCIACSFLF